MIAAMRSLRYLDATDLWAAVAVALFLAGLWLAADTFIDNVKLAGIL